MARHLPLPTHTHKHTCKGTLGKRRGGGANAGPWEREGGENAPCQPGRMRPPSCYSQAGITDTGDPPQLDGGMKKGSLLLPDDFHIVGVQKCV